MKGGTHAPPRFDSAVGAIGIGDGVPGAYETPRLRSGDGVPDLIADHGQMIPQLLDRLFETQHR